MANDKKKPYRVFAHVQIDGEGRTRSQGNTVWAINKTAAQKRFRAVMKESGVKVVSIRSVDELEFKNGTTKNAADSGATIIPLIDDDNPNRPKILWMVQWFEGKSRMGREFADLERAKTWARANHGKVTVRPLAPKYRKFLRNGLTHRFALDK